MKDITKKLSQPYSTKDAADFISFKEVNESSRIIKAYWNSFNLIDSSMDMVLQGSFLKSIKDKNPTKKEGRTIKHALYHDLEKIPGVLKSLSEDDFGLYGESELIDDELGNYTLERYKNGVFREHSIGYNYVAGKIKLLFKDDTATSELYKYYIKMAKNPEKAEERGYFYVVSEINLHEVSTVVFGANEQTPFVGFKAENILESPTEKIAFLNERNLELLKAMKAHKYSDSIFEKCEIQLKQIAQSYTELLAQSLEPSIKDTLIQQRKAGIDYDYIVKNLKIN